MSTRPRRADPGGLRSALRGEPGPRAAKTRRKQLATEKALLKTKDLRENLVLKTKDLQKRGKEIDPKYQFRP